MGQHKIADSANKRPNNTRMKRRGAPVLCIVCNNPNAIFYADDTAGIGEDKKVYRLAKTMKRITTKSAPEVMYVHMTPCLGVLVQNWAGIVANYEQKKRGGSNGGVLSIPVEPEAVEAKHDDPPGN